MGGTGAKAAILHLCHMGRDAVEKDGSKGLPSAPAHSDWVHRDSGNA
jgi:hypothetical protein